jgi:predicted transcriptional regulator
MREKKDDITRLGDLEAEVMNAVWDAGEATVHEVHRVLEGTRGCAYTTVMTVMGRLTDKGLLLRRKAGRAYIYAPARSREALGGLLLDRVIQRVYRGASSDAVAHLLESDEQVNEQELDRLEALIRRKRRDRQS